MLLLVTIVLVLIAAITLLIGIFGDNLALIFVSIGSSALAAIVLAVLSQASRRKARDEAAAATATSTSTSPEVTPVPAARPAMPTPAAAPAPAVAPAAVATAVAVADLPIADYDSLRVNEILPSLEGLDLDQLEAVAQHEETTKNRATILDRIDELMDELEAAEAGGVAPVVAIPDESVADLEDEIEEEVDEAVEEGELVSEEGVSGGFPIDDYESLSEAEIIAAIGDLDADQLEEVAEHEETHSNRDRVLDAIDDRLDVLEGVVAAPASAPVAAVKKAATKKAAGKKAAVTKKAAATRKAAVAPPTRAAAAPKKAAVATKKAAAPVKRAAAVPKRAAAVKKAAPVKKAAAPAPKRAAAPAAKVAKAAKKAAKSAKKVR